MQGVVVVPQPVYQLHRIPQVTIVVHVVVVVVVFVVILVRKLCQVRSEVTEDREVSRGRWDWIEVKSGSGQETVCRCRGVSE